MAKWNFVKSPEPTGLFKTSLNTAIAARHINLMREVSRAQGLLMVCVKYMVGTMLWCIVASAVLYLFYPGMTEEYIHNTLRGHSLFVGTGLVFIMWANVFPGWFVEAGRRSFIEEVPKGSTMSTWRWIGFFSVFPFSGGVVLAYAMACTLHDPRLAVQVFRTSDGWSYTVRSRASVILADPRTAFLLAYAEHTAWWDRRVEALQAAADRLSLCSFDVDNPTHRTSRFACLEAAGFVKEMTVLSGALDFSIQRGGRLGCEELDPGSWRSIEYTVRKIEGFRRNTNDALDEVARLEAAQV